MKLTIVPRMNRRAGGVTITSPGVEVDLDLADAVATVADAVTDRLKENFARGIAGDGTVLPPLARSTLSTRQRHGTGGSTPANETGELISGTTWRMFERGETTASAIVEPPSSRREAVKMYLRRGYALFSAPRDLDVKSLVGARLARMIDVAGARSKKQRTALPKKTAMAAKRGNRG
jgi:hypothetical protein